MQELIHHLNFLTASNTRAGALFRRRASKLHSSSSLVSPLLDCCVNVLENMAKCHFSAMCIVCTVVSVVSVALLVGIWTFQFLAHAETPAALWENYLLPDNLLPDVYYVTLWPRLQQDDRGLYIFTGNFSGVFSCVKETDLILIHSHKRNLPTAGGHLARLTALSDAPSPDIKSTRT